MTDDTKLTRTVPAHRTIMDELRREIEMRKEMEARLLVAMEVAEAASAAKNEFLANISHEFRTPMTLIISSSQLLGDYVADPHQREILHILQKASNRMMNLVNDLLDFAESEMGRVKLEEDVFNVRELLDETIERFLPAAETKNIRLSSRVHLTLSDMVVGDVHRLQQVLANLLDNALKFTPKGKIECILGNDNPMEYGIKARSDRRCFHFRIKDTGVGISSDKQRMIFDVFTQVDGSTTRKYGGSGLGLALTRQLVEMMDGRIWVESEEGRGSTFHVIIQLRRAQDQVPSVAS